MLSSCLALLMALTGTPPGAGEPLPSGFAGWPVFIVLLQVLAPLIYYFKVTKKEPTKRENPFVRHTNR